MTGIFYLPWGFDPGEILVVLAFLTNYFGGADVWQRVLFDDVCPSFLVGVLPPNVRPAAIARVFAQLRLHSWRSCMLYVGTL